MRKLVQLLEESTKFTLTREHWANSITLIGIVIGLGIVGPELDRILEWDGALSAATSFISSYLILVVFPIAWYRAIATTGHVRVEYRFSRRTWIYIAALFKLMALLLLLVAVVVIVAVVADFSLPDRADFYLPRLWGWLIGLAFTYVFEVRFGFLFPAAANDNPMTLGDALDASAVIQWSLLGTLFVVQLIGALMVYVLNGLHDTAPTPLTHFVGAAGVVLLFLVQGFTVAATGIAYKKVNGADA
jgi:hypothetical protein